MKPYLAPGKVGPTLPALWISGFDIEIPELEPTQAPVVATWTSTCADNIGRAGTKTVSCRYHEGSFYVLASILGDVVQNSDRFADPGDKQWQLSAQFVLLAQVLCAGATKIKNSSWPENKRVLAVTDEHFSTATHEDRVVDTQTRKFARRHADAMMDTMEVDRAAARRNSEFISVDNVLWRRVSEPKIGVRPTPDLPWFSAVYVELGDGISLDLTGERPGPLEWMFFPLDEIAAARARAVERGMQIDERSTLSSTNITRPDLFSFQAAENHVYRTLKYAVKELGSCVGSMSSEAAESYLNLRDEVDRLGTGSEFAEMESALETHMLPFLSLMPEDGRMDGIKSCLALVDFNKGCGDKSLNFLAWGR
jgi:hypothetical protein